MLYRRPLPSQEELLELLDYDPLTGIFKWKPRLNGHRSFNKRYAGKVAGNWSDRGYLSISVNDVSYRAHRLAYRMMTGEEHLIIDHKNRDRRDNSFENLRPATFFQSAVNKDKPCSNTTGYKSVFKEPSGKYRARVIWHGKVYHLGNFILAEDAAIAVKVRERELHGEFAAHK